VKRSSTGRDSALDGQHFETYLAALRKGSLFAPGLSIEQIKGWERDNSRKKLIDRAKAEWKERSDRINASVTATAKLIKEGKYKLPRPSKACSADDDPNTIVFNSKILPNIEKDAASGSLFTEATLAAMNLSGWADAIARYARAADNSKHKAKVKAFFIELGKALQSERKMWDATDELIATNYYASQRFSVSLCEMTEAQASETVGLTAGAYDKRLLRLGIRKDRVGRPSKQDKESR
jgi:hypothetical protein